VWPLWDVAVFAYDYLDFDMQEAAHGRACAAATGVRRVLPDKYVFTYQGRRRPGCNRNSGNDTCRKQGRETS